MDMAGFRIARKVKRGTRNGFNSPNSVGFLDRPFPFTRGFTVFPKVFTEVVDALTFPDNRKQ